MCFDGIPTHTISETISRDFLQQFSFFQHLDPTKSVSPPVYIQELFKLFFHMYEVINEIS